MKLRLSASTILPAAIALVGAPSVRAVDYSTTAGGIWGNAAIWDPSGGPPNLNTAGNTATIGHAVTYSGGSTTTPVNAAFQMSNGTSLTLNSGGSFNNTSTATWFMAGFGGNQITVDLNGGSVLNPGNAQIAMFGLNGGSALVNINEGTLRAGTNNTENSSFSGSGASSINIGITSGSSNAIGTINVGDGTGAAGSAIIDLSTNNRNLNIGWVSAADKTGKVKGVVNVASDGVINAGSSSQIRIGRGAALNGEASELNINGGAVNAANNSIIIGGLLDNAHGRLSLTSGTLSAGTLRLANSNTSIKGEYLQSGSTATIGTIEFNHGNADVILSGGITTVNGFTFTNPTSPATPGTRTLTLNGGTLRAGASSTTYLTAGTNFTATLGTNGGTIDTNGFNITIAAPFGGSGAFTKSGAGTLTLTGNNGYTGNTNVTTGTLALSGSGSVSNSPVIHVSTGAVLDVGSVTGGWTLGSLQTLQGSGTISGAATINGAHAPGSSAGLQTFGSNLAYGAPSAFEWELTSNVTTGRGTAFDAVDVAGSLGINPGATFRIILGTDFNPASPFWQSDRVWDVFSVTGAKTGLFGSFELFNAGNLSNELDYTPYGSFSYEYSSNSGQLVWTAVPEPSGALVASLCAIGLLRRRRAK